MEGGTPSTSEAGVSSLQTTHFPQHGLGLPPQDPACSVRLRSIPSFLRKPSKLAAIICPRSSGNAVRDLRRLRAHRENAIRGLRHVRTVRENAIRDLRNLRAVRENAIRDLRRLRAHRENAIRGLRRLRAVLENAVRGLRHVRAHRENAIRGLRFLRATLRGKNSPHKNVRRGCDCNIL